MTREEAIKRLKYIRAEYEEPLELNSREDIRRGIQVYIDAIDMAIEAIEVLARMKMLECGECGDDSFCCKSCGKEYDGAVFVLRGEEEYEKVIAWMPVEPYMGAE